MRYMQPFKPAPSVKPMINIGCLFDITTGKYTVGINGESILNAGLSYLTGIVGKGNSWKSTIMHYMAFIAMGRIPGSFGNSYDTEQNMQVPRLSRLAKSIREITEDIFMTGRWSITDKTVYSGNKWHSSYRDFLEQKVKSTKEYEVTTPFLDFRTGDFIRMLRPTFNEMDSFTEFETDDVIDINERNELGESGANTIHMRQGLAKMRFLMESTRINPAAHNYLLMTAHIGQESSMQNAGPAGQVPITKLSTLKNGDKIKGVTDKFTFIVHNCWYSHNSKVMLNDSTKGPEYPRNSEDNLKMDQDLNCVQIRNLRGKSGPSGLSLTIIISQQEGVLPHLTEYHHLKDMGKYWGMGGNPINHYLEIYPECKLSRTTIRGKIDSDAKLRRALNITSEMFQMSYLWHDLPEGLLCEPKVLYEDLKTKGYDWDMILEKTRGWWTIDNDQPNPWLFLSTMDLLNMRQGTYHPFWLEEDKKTIKKEYQLQS